MGRAYGPSAYTAMSAMISRTFNYITSNLPLANNGPRWSVPDRNAGPCAHLPSGLATFLNSVYQAETASEERELIAVHMRSVEEKLREAPEAKTAVVADAMVRGEDVTMYASMLKLKSGRLAT